MRVRYKKDHEFTKSITWGQAHEVWIGKYF